MARKKQEEASGGAPEWMATFSDLMNLLLCFFVLLFSMSSVDEEKFQSVIASLNASFSIFEGGGSSLLDGSLISSGISQLNDFNDYYNNMGMIQEELEDAIVESMQQYHDKIEEENMDASEEIGEEIEDQLKNEGLSDSIEIEVEEYYVQLTMNGKLLFDSGKAEIKESSLDTLSKLGDILKHYDKHQIEIIGHTDIVPQSPGGKYSDNWELSQGRAYSVLKYLKNEKNMDDKTMECSGKGETEPIATNETAEGRELNRRVEIRIYNKYQSGLADINTAIKDNDSDKELN